MPSITYNDVRVRRLQVEPDSLDGAQFDPDELTPERIRWARQVVAVGLRTMGFRKKHVATILNLHPNTITKLLDPADGVVRSASGYVPRKGGAK